MRGYTSSNYGLELFTSIQEKMAKSRRLVFIEEEEEEEPLLIYTAQGSPFRRKKLSVINGSPEQKKYTS